MQEQKNQGMDSFIVSARKYRPVTFDTVVGQNTITSTLKNAIRNKQLAQAFLFTGPRGVGKTTCARILAKTINCTNVTENIEPCNECDSCKAFNTSASFNVHELDAASNNSVDDIRALVDQVRIPPQAVAYKVYIIDEVHMLSQQAFNAFLKTLEEPPAYAKFILATTEKHKILPTILSRCQIFDFNRITIDDIAGHLAHVASCEKIIAEPEALHLIAQKADGGLRDALSIFDQIASFAGSKITYNNVLENLNVLDVNTYFELTEFIARNDIGNTLLKLNEIYESGHDAHHFINGLGDHIRNLLVSKDAETVSLLETSPAIKEKYRTHAQLWDVTTLIKALDICSKADLNYKNSGNKRLLVELALIQFCTLTGALAAGMNAPAQVAPIKQQGSVPPPPQTPTQTPPTQTAKPVQAPLPPAVPIATTPVPQVKTVSPPPANTFKSETEKKQEIASGSVNMSSILNPSVAASTSDKQEKEEQPAPEPELPAADFTEVKLREAWANFANMQEANSNFRSVLTANQPAKESDDTVTFSVISSFQENEIKTKYQEIMTFLRQELNNSKLNLRIEVKAEDVPNTAKPFTIKDKFKSMSEKNPDLNNLKDKMELDLDY